MATLPAVILRTLLVLTHLYMLFALKSVYSGLATHFNHPLLTNPEMNIEHISIHIHSFPIKDIPKVPIYCVSEESTKHRIHIIIISKERVSYG